jgi:hypothetical protein
MNIQTVFLSGEISNVKITFNMYELIFKISEDSPTKSGIKISHKFSNFSKNTDELYANRMS